MCVVTTTSVWVAVAPTCFFILWNRLKPRDADSAPVFICVNYLQNAEVQISGSCLCRDFLCEHDLLNFKAFKALRTG